MCRFCENDGTMKGIENAPFILESDVGELFGKLLQTSVYIAGGELRLETACGTEQGVEYKKINFCPFCGGKL